MANETPLDSTPSVNGLNQQDNVGGAKGIKDVDAVADPTRRKLLKKIALLTIGAAVGSSLTKIFSLTAPQTPTPTESPSPSPAPTETPTPTIGETETAQPQPPLPDLSIYSPENVAIPDPSLYSKEEAAIIMDIEATYNINIFSVQQAREYAHRYLSGDQVTELGIDNWQDTKVGFDMEQLILLRELVSYMPKVILLPIYPQRFGIILRENDLKDLDGHVLSGQEVPRTRMIETKKDGINPKDRKGTFSLLIHEASHSWDEVLKNIAWLRVRDILGDKNLAELPDMKAYFANKQGLRSNYPKFTDVQKAALSTFSSFVPGQMYGEGIAGLSQLYVDGYLSFMNAVGPILDGNGYLSSDYVGNIDNADALLKKYPKAQAIYDYYKQLFFGGMEYDAELLHNIQYGS